MRSVLPRTPLALIGRLCLLMKMMYIGSQLCFHAQTCKSTLTTFEVWSAIEQTLSSALVLRADSQGANFVPYRKLSLIIASASRWIKFRCWSCIMRRSCCTFGTHCCQSHTSESHIVELTGFLSCTRTYKHHFLLFCIAYLTSLEHS